MENFDEKFYFLLSCKTVVSWNKLYLGTFIKKKKNHGDQFFIWQWIMPPTPPPLKLMMHSAWNLKEVDL